MYYQLLYYCEFIGCRLIAKVNRVGVIIAIASILAMLLFGHVSSSLAELPDKSKFPAASSSHNEVIRIITEKVDTSDGIEFAKSNLSVAFPSLHENESGAATIEVRGLVKPIREAALSTNRFAKISEIHFKEGEHFKQGEKLVRFDCLQQRAEERAVEADVSAREAVYKNNQDLSQYNAVGSLELELSKTQYEKSLADLNVLKIRNYECAIKAPWNGRITEVKANKLEVVEPGREIMRIIDDSSLEIEMIVPSKWLTWLQPGMAHTIVIDETGKSYESAIVRIGARVDPVSQTLRIFASFKNGASDVLAGMSGKVIFDVPNQN